MLFFPKYVFFYAITFTLIVYHYRNPYHGIRVSRNNSIKQSIFEQEMILFMTIKTFYFYPFILLIFAY